MPRMTPTDLIGKNISDTSPTQLADIGIRRPYQTPEELMQDKVCYEWQGTDAYPGPESELQKTAEEYLTAKGYPFLHMWKAKGNRKGWPDLTILLPNGKTLYVELKVKGGYLTKEQKLFIMDAERLGHTVKICTSIEQVIEVIREAV